MIPAPSSAGLDRRAAFRLLFGSLLVVGIGNSMLYAILPPLWRELGLADASIGWIFALSALIWVFASPSWGRRSDRAGRKPIITLGLAAYGASMSLMALVVEAGREAWISGIAVFIGLMLARAIFGALGSAASPAAQAYVADRTSPSERTTEIAALTAAFALGSAMGPGLAAAIAARVSLVAPIWITAGLAFLAALAIWRFLPGDAAPVRDPALTKVKEPGPWGLALDKRVSGHLLFGVGMSVVTGTLTQTFTFYLMDRLSLSGAAGAEQAAIGFMVGALAALASQMGLVGRLKLSPRGLMAFGIALVALGVGTQIVAHSLGGLMLAQMLQGLGFGLARAGFSGGASTAVSPQEQGAVAGLVVAANGAGFVVSPLVGGVAYDALGMTAPLWLSLVLSVAMIWFALQSKRLAAPAWAPNGSEPGQGAENP
ncbi:MAG: MFS transporter [Caulobacterales bacterium]